MMALAPARLTRCLPAVHHATGLALAGSTATRRKNRVGARGGKAEAVPMHSTGLTRSRGGVGGAIPHQAAPGGPPLQLRAGETFRLERPSRGASVRCFTGKIWLTQTGVPGDFLLSAGETFVTRGRGRVVAEPLTPHAVLTCGQPAAARDLPS